jgi:hypothetical protein
MTGGARCLHSRRDMREQRARRTPWPEEREPLARDALDGRLVELRAPTTIDTPSDDVLLLGEISGNDKDSGGPTHLKKGNGSSGRACGSVRFLPTRRTSDQ